MPDPFRLPTMRRTRRIGPSPTAHYMRPTEGLPLTPRSTQMLDTTPDVVLYWMTKVSRERAMRAYRLKKKGIVGSLPELLTYDWLEGRNHIFDFQSSIMGGRLILGGAVADFIIEDLIPGGLVIWRVQGDYWHTQAKRVQSDFIQRERLLTESYMGVPVEQVVDLWESAIYWAAPLVFEMAEGGVEIGRRAAR
jgi:hypothetical protein